MTARETPNKQMKERGLCGHCDCPMADDGSKCSSNFPSWEKEGKGINEAMWWSSERAKWGLAGNNSEASGGRQDSVFPAGQGSMGVKRSSRYPSQEWINSI